MTRGQPTPDDFVFKLHSEYFLSLTEYAKTILGDAEAAKDVVADLFLTIALNVEKFKDINEKGIIRPYLFESVKKNCYGEFRYKKIRLKHQTEVEIILQRQLKSNQRAREAYTDFLILFKPALNLLTPTQKEVCNLFFIKKLTTEEIAEMTQIPKDKVQRHLREGIAKLKEYFKGRNWNPWGILPLIYFLNQI